MAFADAAARQIENWKVNPRKDTDSYTGGQGYYGASTYGNAQRLCRCQREHLPSNESYCSNCYRTQFKALCPLVEADRASNLALFRESKEAKELACSMATRTTAFNAGVSRQLSFVESLEVEARNDIEYRQTVESAENRHSDAVGRRRLKLRMNKGSNLSVPHPTSTTVAIICGREASRCIALAEAFHATQRSGLVPIQEANRLLHELHNLQERIREREGGNFDPCLVAQRDECRRQVIHACLRVQRQLPELDERIRRFDKLCERSPTEPPKSLVGVLATLNGAANGAFVSMMSQINAAQAKQRALTSAQERVVCIGIVIQMIGSCLALGITGGSERQPSDALDALHNSLADALQQRDRAWRDVELPDETDAAAEVDDAFRCLRREVVRLLQQAESLAELGQRHNEAHVQMDEARELQSRFKETIGALEETRIDLEIAQSERRTAELKRSRQQAAQQDATDHLTQFGEDVASRRAALAQRSHAVDQIVERMSELAPHFPELRVLDHAVAAVASRVEKWGAFFLPGRRLDLYNDIHQHKGRVMMATYDRQPCVLKRLVMCEVSIKVVEKEARVKARVRHPNVLSPLGVFVDGDSRQPANYFLHFPRCAELKERIDAGMDVVTKLRVALGCVDGLMALHALGIVHGDISVSNVLLKDDGTPVLADFCESEIAESRTIRLRATNVAPEVLSEGRVSSAADVYAMGAVFKELLTDVSIAAVGDTVRDMCEADCKRRPTLLSVFSAIAEAVSRQTQVFRAAADEAANARAVAEEKLQTLTSEVAARDRWSAFPTYWISKRVDPPQRFATGFMRSRLQTLLPLAKVSSVSRLENEILWRKYCAEREAISDKLQRRTELHRVSVEPHLHAASVAAGFGLLNDTSVSCLNEVYLFHGTTREAAANIQLTGFDFRRAGDAAGTVFGCATYFASDIRKAMQYCRGALIVARVVLGSFVIVHDSRPCTQLRRPPPLPGTSDDADSVIGERRGSSSCPKEFVVYTLTQAYPEVIVILNCNQTGGDFREPSC